MNRRVRKRTTKAARKNIQFLPFQRFIFFMCLSMSIHVLIWIGSGSKSNKCNTLPDLPTSFPPITATLTVFFCFRENPLKMLKGLVFFWLGEDMGVTSWAGWGAATVKYRQKNTLFVTQQLLRHTRGGCSLVPVVCPNHPQ